MHEVADQSNHGEQRVFVESWAQSYGSPYLIADDDPGSDDAQLIEDGGTFYAGVDREHFDDLIFIDGVRRGETSLYQVNDGHFVRGITGSHACGSVIARRDKGLVFGELHSERLVIWGSGVVSSLPSMKGGWDWRPVSVASDDATAPLAELQARMRAAEGRLAESLAAERTMIVADGPLNFALRRDLPIIGFIKRHQRAYLAPIEHAQITLVPTGQRTALFRLGDERFSCYLRLAHDRLGGPWAGVIRLEIPSSLGAQAASGLADTLACHLPRYAGVLHRDPRAPQNLQPIGALENRLRRNLGSEALAERAVRDAIRETQRRPVRAS
jgi:hypothetical protein